MKIENLLDYQTILANQARPVHFAIRFEAPAVEQPRPRPAAFCVVLDRSGSMDGDPLKQAKTAAQLAVRNLRPDDQFSLVIFDDVARCIIPLQSARHAKSWSNMIDQIHAGDSTNLTAGWMLGRDELKKSSPDTSRRLLLLTDGQLNVGIVDPGEVRGIISSGLEKDLIRTSCLGFGERYSEDLMSDCARAANGQFYDAKSPELLPAIFASELDGLQKIVVQNLRVRIKRLDFCDGYELLGEYPIVGLPDDRKEIMVGDLVSGETRILCFELGVLPLPTINGQPVCSLEGERLLEVEFVYDEITAGGVSSKSLSQVIRIQSTQNPDEVKITEEVIPWVAMQKAGRVMDQVNKRMDSGRSQESLSLLESTIAQLKQYGPADKVEEAVQRLEQLRALIQAAAFSLEERKSNKYRSSSYLRMSSSELWSMRERSPGFKKRKAADAKTVWLVNDDEYVRKSICIILEHGVPEIRLCKFDRSISAWESLELSKPDLLIMADMMVQMRGKEIAEQLFARGDTFPVIVTTAWDGTQEWVDALASKGMNIKVINLPMTPDVIWDMTRTALGLSPRPNAST